MPALFMKIFKEPLFHFILIGAVFFLLFDQAGQDEPQAESNLVHISSGRIEQIALIFEKTWSRKPSQAELEVLVEDYAIEEIYVRKAREMGIDAEDAIIRRRLRQKVEFLMEDFSALEKPNDEDLSAYLDEHPDKFRRGSSYSFEQVYMNPKRHGDELETHISAQLDALKNGQSVHGDSAMMQRNYSAVNAQQIQQNFGLGFLQQLNDLPLNLWSGPIPSSLGQHLILLREIKEGGLPDFTEIRTKLEVEWQNARRAELHDQLKQQFMQEYTIEIEWPDETTSS